MKLTAQAITLGELSKSARAEVIAVSQDAKALHSSYSSVGVKALAVEIAVSFASIIE